MGKDQDIRWIALNLFRDELLSRYSLVWGLLVSSVRDYSSIGGGFSIDVERYKTTAAGSFLDVCGQLSFVDDRVLVQYYDYFDKLKQREFEYNNPQFVEDILELLSEDCS